MRNCIKLQKEASGTFGKRGAVSACVLNPKDNYHLTVGQFSPRFLCHNSQQQQAAVEVQTRQANSRLTARC